MEVRAARLLAFGFALGLVGAHQTFAPVTAKAAPRTELSDVRKTVEQPATTRDEAPEAGPVAWDCVPNYWWGYWTWAWQPCAWIDRSYVEGTIGAIAETKPERRAPQEEVRVQ